MYFCAVAGAHFRRRSNRATELRPLPPEVYRGRPRVLLASITAPDHHTHRPAYEDATSAGGLEERRASDLRAQILLTLKVSRSEIRPNVRKISLPKLSTSFDVVGGELRKCV
jgi:hypothetical protein